MEAAKFPLPNAISGCGAAGRVNGDEVDRQSADESAFYFSPGSVEPISYRPTADCRVVNAGNVRLNPSLAVLYPSTNDLPERQLCMFAAFVVKKRDGEFKNRPVRLDDRAVGVDARSVCDTYEGSRLLVNRADF
jgi:hypothetical protein